MGPDTLPIFVKMKCITCFSHLCQRMTTARCMSKRTHRGTKCRAAFMHDVVPAKGVKGMLTKLTKSFPRQAVRFLTSPRLMDQILTDQTEQEWKKCVFQCSKNTRLPFEDTTCREANGHCLAAKEMKCSQDSDCDPFINMEDAHKLQVGDKCEGANKNTARPVMTEPMRCTSCSNERCSLHAATICNEIMPRECKQSGALYVDITRHRFHHTHTHTHTYVQIQREQARPHVIAT